MTATNRWFHIRIPFWTTGSIFLFFVRVNWRNMRFLERCHIVILATCAVVITLMIGQSMLGQRSPNEDQIVINTTRIDEHRRRLERVERDADTLQSDVNALKADVSAIKQTLQDMKGSADANRQLLFAIGAGVVINILAKIGEMFVLRRRPHHH